MRSGNKHQAALRLLGAGWALNQVGWGRGQLGQSARPLGGAVRRDLPQRPVLASAPRFSFRTSALGVGLWPSAAHCS